MDSFLSLFDPNDNDDTSDRSTGQRKQNVFYKKKGRSKGKTVRGPLLINNEKDVNSNQLRAQIAQDFERGMLPPEPQLGNIEYKLKLINPSAQRFEHLVTQMKWRLREGHGEAIYEIGVADSGHLCGLNDNDMASSLETLRRMAQSLGATTTILRRKSVGTQSSVVEVLVRKIPDDQHSIEVRVGVLGGVNAGKSTLLGVLTQGELDNGRGSARLNMFRHRHEIQSGRTSCISHETVGFDSQGSVINYKFNEMMTAEEICDRSTKLVTFMDLAGHRRYLRTTVLALTGYSPHYAMLVVAADTEGINSMTYEHLDLIKALDMPFFIVVTKIESTSTENIVQKLKSILTSVDCRKIPFLIGSEDDVLTASTRQKTDQIVPIFCVSNVNGIGLDLVTRFLFVLSPGISNVEKDHLEQLSCKFLVDEIFKVGDIGPVVGGLLAQGILTENVAMKIGPLQDGSFFPVNVQSIHRNKAPCRVVRAGQSSSIAFMQNQNLPSLRSGMVLLPDDSENEGDQPFGSLFFQAKISVLFHATAIYEGFQVTVHIGNIRQTAIIEGIMGCSKIGTNEQASVLFRFMCHPEYVIPGQRILFREGKSKGVGKVTQVFPLNKKFKN